MIKQKNVPPMPSEESVKLTEKVLAICRKYGLTECNLGEVIVILDKALTEYAQKIKELEKDEEMYRGYNDELIDEIVELRRDNEELREFNGKLISENLKLRGINGKARTDN